MWKFAISAVVGLISATVQPAVQRGVLAVTLVVGSFVDCEDGLVVGLGDKDVSETGQQACCLNSILPVSIKGTSVPYLYQLTPFKAFKGECLHFGLPLGMSELIIIESYLFDPVHFLL